MSDDLKGLLCSADFAGNDCEQRIAAFQGIGVQTKSDLLAQTESTEKLADVQQRVSQQCSDVPASLVADLRRAAQKSRLAVGGFPDPSPETESPILFTSPHSIYLKREGHAHHVPEWHTSDLARKFARAVKGAFLTWTQDEERRSKQLFDSSGEPDDTNVDPNFTPRSGLGESPWTRELRAVRRRFGPRACLHVDLHGCQNPRQGEGSHVVVGLRAMELAGREDVERLRQELQSVLSVVLKGFTVSVNPKQHLTGAWEDGRYTLSQQSLCEEGGAWTHAVQLEMCAKLRKMLSESTALQELLAQGILIAWVTACRHDPGACCVTARTQCIGIMREWMVRCTRFHTCSAVVPIARRRKKARAGADCEEDAERVSANSEAAGFLCKGPGQEAEVQYEKKLQEVRAHVLRVQGDGPNVGDPPPLPPLGQSNAAVSAKAARPGPDNGSSGEQERVSDMARLSGKLEESRKQGDKQVEVAALLALTELHLKNKKKDAAFQAAENARALACELSDMEQEANALRATVNVHLLAEKVAEATELAEQEVKRFQEAGGGIAEMVMQLAICDVLISTKRGREAQRRAEKALASFQELGSKIGEAAATEVLALANANVIQCGMSKALKMAERALTMYQELGKLEKKASMLRTISSMHTSEGESAEAVDSAMESRDLCRCLGDCQGEAASLNAMAKAQLTRSDGAIDALDLAHSSMTLAKELKDERAELAAWEMKVAAHLHLGDHVEALGAATETLNRARSLEDADLIASAMETIMDIHVQSGFVGKALLAAKAELRQAKTSGNAKREAFALQRVANTQLDCNQPREALMNAKQARRLLENAGDKKGEALACSVFASGLAALDLPEALTVCESSVQLHRDMGDTAGSVKALQLLASVQHQQGDLDGALKTAWQQQKVSQDAGQKDEEADALLWIAEFISKVQGARLALLPIKTAREIYKAMGDKESEAKAVLQGANYYLVEESLKDALSGAKEAQEMFHTAGHMHGEANALLTVAHVHWRKINQNYDKRAADDMMNVLIAARKLYESVDDSQGLAAALQLTCNCHLAAGDGEQALQAASDALELYETLENMQEAALTLLQMAQACSLTGNAEAVLECCTKAEEIGDEGIKAEARQVFQSLSRT